MTPSAAASSWARAPPSCCWRSWSTPRRRGAKIYAEFVGYGATCDAYHMTAPRPDGSGGAKAMAMAIADAGIQPEEVDYINAHGTSTHLNDAGETAAVKTVFGRPRL